MFGHRGMPVADHPFFIELRGFLFVQFGCDFIERPANGMFWRTSPRSSRGCTGVDPTGRSFGKRDQTSNLRASVISIWICFTSASTFSKRISPRIRRMNSRHNCRSYRSPEKSSRCASTVTCGCSDWKVGRRPILVTAGLACRLRPNRHTHHQPAASAPARQPGCRSEYRSCRRVRRHAPPGRRSGKAYRTPAAISTSPSPNQARIWLEEIAIPSSVRGGMAVSW